MVKTGLTCLKLVLPSIRMKSSTSASRSQPSGNFKNNRISQTTSSNIKNKVEDHPRSVKSSSNKKNRVSEPICNANVTHSMLNVNSELICATCNECMFDAIHDLCVLDFVNDVNVRSKSKSSKRIKKQLGNLLVVQIVLWYLDSGCSKHITGNRSQLINFVHKFLDLEVAFRKHTCYIRDLEGVDLLKGSRLNEMKREKRDEGTVCSLPQTSLLKL
ncbi:hypothetical protein Tco_1409808 [Tanacetum coccineum]